MCKNNRKLGSDEKNSNNLKVLSVGIPGSNRIPKAGKTVHLAKLGEENQV